MSIAYGAADASSEKPRRISVLIDTDGNIERVFDPVVPAEHPDEVLAVL
jgi:peroxiredoxin